MVVLKPCLRNRRRYQIPPVDGKGFPDPRGKHRARSMRCGGLTTGHSVAGMGHSAGLHLCSVGGRDRGHRGRHVAGCIDRRRRHARRGRIRSTALVPGEAALRTSTVHRAGLRALTFDVGVAPTSIRTARGHASERCTRPLSWPARSARARSWRSRGLPTRRRGCTESHQTTCISMVILLTSLAAPMTAFAFGDRHFGLRVGPCGSSRPGGRAPRSRPARRSSARR